MTLYEKDKMTINEKMKWPTDKPRYDKNYLRLYGKKCPICANRKEVWLVGNVVV